MFAAGKGARSNKTAIAVVAFASSATSAGSKVIDIAKPTNSSAGHIMCAMIVQESTSASWNTAASWTRVYESTGEPAVLVAVRTLSAADAAISSFTFSSSVGTNKLAGSIVTLQNAAYSTVGPANVASIGNTSFTAIAVQSDFSNSMLMTFFGTSIFNATFTTPSGMSAVDSDSDATRPSWAVFNQIVGAANTGNRITSAGGTSNYHLGINFLFKPV